MITLQQAKDFLDVFHNADDDKLTLLLAGAVGEAEQIINRPLAEVESAGARLGVLLLLQAMYQASPDDADKLRAAAEVKLWPYRVCIGV